MSKKIAGLVAPLILVCVLSSCEQKSIDAPSVAELPLPPDQITKRGSCQEVKGYVDDKPYHHCYYPWKRSEAVAARCSTDVEECERETGECAKAPSKQTPC
jgi:hypothetical protein